MQLICLCMAKLMCLCMVNSSGLCMTIEMFPVQISMSAAMSLETEIDPGDRQVG